MLKLNPDIGFSDETIRERLQEFVFLPGVNIEFLYADSGEHVWEINAAIPFSEGRHIHQLTHAETENVIRYYNGPYTVDPLYLSPLRISMEVLSLGIGKHCDDSDINGYLYVALIYDETMLETEQDLNEYSGFAFRYNSNAVMLTKNQQILVNAAPLNIGFPGISFNQIKVYFNGVLHAATFDQGKPYYNVCGNLSLRGAHRPDAHVSRDGNAIFSLNTLSLLNHAFRSAVRSQTKQNRHFQHVCDGVRLPPRLCRLNEMPTYGAVMKADGIETLWLEERIIYTEAGVMSIGEIQKYVSDYGGAPATKYLQEQAYHQRHRCLFDTEVPKSKGPVPKPANGGRSLWYQGGGGSNRSAPGVPLPFLYGVRGDRSSAGRGCPLQHQPSTIPDSHPAGGGCGDVGR